MNVIIPEPDDPRVLRNVHLGDTGYRLMTWDTGGRLCTGQYRIGYAFWHPDGSLLFSGADYGASPMHSLDSDKTLRGLVGFLTLRPGDTDDEYFEDYTLEQLDWARDEAESLQEWGMEADRDFEPPDFEDLDT